MKTNSKIIFTFLLSLFVLSSCTEKEFSPENLHAPDPQLSTPCNSLGSGSMIMSQWAPTMQSYLNNAFTETPGGTMSCVATNSTTTKTRTLCWSSEIEYSGQIAADEVCRLKDWAKQNRPPATGTGLFSLDKWYITNITYVHDPNATCANHCSDPQPLVMTVTYTRYRCKLRAVASEQLQVDEVLVRLPSSDPIGPSDGTLEFYVKKDNEELTPPVDLTIKDGNGTVLQRVASFPNPTQGNTGQVLQFEILTHSAAECTFEFTWAPL